MEGPPMSSSPRWRPQIQTPTTTSTPQLIEKKITGLPSLGYLDLEKIKREAQEYEQRHGNGITPASSQPPLASPQSVYPGPPPPYSYPSSAVSSTIGFNGYISPPDSRRLSSEEKEQSQTRQSLPSIHEALGKDPTSIYSSSPTSSVPTQTSHPATTISPTAAIPRSHPETILPGPPNPYASSQSHPSYPPEPPDKRMQPSAFNKQHQHQHHHDDPQPPTHRPPAHDSMPGSAQGTPTSPVPPARLGPHAVNPPQTSSIFPPTPQPLQPVQAPQPLTSQPYNHHYPPAYSYPPASTSSLAYSQVQSAGSWRSDGYEFDRVEEGRRAATKQSPRVHSYGESVKRHLDIFDLETSLNEIAEGSGRALEFTRKYGTKAHQMQRSGISSALPPMGECEDMLRLQNTVLTAFERIREVILAQQHALAEQRSRDEASKARQGSFSDESTSYLDKQEGAGGFAGADAKKRRGRNAPPGRCHSCNRAETPEWRRGPDGARTLCNACGLHYAKLTRKLGPKASIGSSNLRPKDNASTP